MDHKMNDAEAEAYTRLQGDVRKGWTKTAKVEIEYFSKKDGGSAYASLSGPAAKVREGCASSMQFKGLPAAVAGAQDYCDARGILITDWRLTKL